MLQLYIMNTRKLIGTICVLLAATFWGLGGIAGQFLFENYHISAAWLIMLRQIFSGLIFLTIAYFQGANIIKPVKHNFSSLVIFSAFGAFCCQYGFFWCVELCNAPTATVLQYTCPVLVMLWEYFRGDDDLNLKEYLGVILTITGVFLVCTHGDYTTLHLSPLTMFSGALSAIGMAFYKVYPLQLLRKYSIATVLGWGQLFSGVGIMTMTNPFDIVPSWDWQATAAALFLLLGATVLTFWLDMKGLMIIGPIQTSMISSWEPVCSMLAAVLLLHTPLVLADFAGITCIVLTILLLSLPKK